MKLEEKKNVAKCSARYFRVIVFCLAMGAALVLAACGHGGGSAQGSASDTSGQASSASAAQSATSRDYSELKKMADDAVTAADSIKDKESDSQQKAKASQEFAEGNTKYRARDYAQAEKKYQEALGVEPTNYGANVNLALALLQNQQNEEALAQALKCVALFPDDAGCLLNAQVAGTACRFDIDDIDKARNDILGKRGDKLVNDVLTPSSTVAGSDPLLWNQAYIYNAIWNRIETEVNAEGLSASAAKEAYENMRGTFEWLIGDGSDEDSIALLAYLDAVASQRGLSEKK